MIWIVSIFILIFSGCQQAPQERHYTEVLIEAPEQAVTDPHAGLDMPAMVMSEGIDKPTAMNTIYSWKAPYGWVQSPGQGMRLASFHLRADEKAIDCSVISLGGMAGGLEANLQRWMGQIGLESSPSDLTKLISSASTIKIKGGQEGKVFDFTTLSQAQSTDKSMVVVMLSMQDETLFIKMTGTVEALKANKQDFFKLVQSIEHKDAASGHS